MFGVLNEKWIRFGCCQYDSRISYMKTHIVVDFEATCCASNEFSREEMEIIEIGACAIGAGYSKIGEFSKFVKPKRNPVLSEFCIGLTTIVQSDVDGANGFSQVLSEFERWLGDFENPVFCSWGRFDKAQLKKDCLFHGVAYPFGEEHLNLKLLFSNGKKFGVGQALSSLGYSFEGTQHRGIDDARNISRLLPYILEKN